MQCHHGARPVQTPVIRRLHKERGITLIELIVTIVLLGIVSVTIGVFLMPAFTANQALERRAGLVDAAESSLRRMARDIRIALPNSVRISPTANGFAIEMIPTAAGGKYCIAGLANCAGAAQLLDMTANDASFDILGCFRNPAFILANGTPAYRLVIGDLDGSVYAVPGAQAVISPAGRNIGVIVQPAGVCGVGASRHRITISGGGHRFLNASVNERLYAIQVAAVPISYVCNTATGTLRRYAGYGLPRATQPTNEVAAPLSTAPSIALVSNNINRCGVLGDTDSVRATGIVTLQLGLAGTNETIELLHQVQLDNSL